MHSKTIEQTLKDKTKEWMNIPEVVGTAIGIFKGNPCIKIFTSLNTTEVQAKIPSTVEGYPIIVEETGMFRMLSEK